jgi:virulence-associated protein VapD
MIKMQIVMDDAKIQRQKRYNVEKIHKTLDAFLMDKLGFSKSADGFYLGSGGKTDFSYFGIAFNTLRKKDWFVDNVKTWLYYNSDASDDPEDFAVEDFKAFCLSGQQIGA